MLVLLFFLSFFLSFLPPPTEKQNQAVAGPVRPIMSLPLLRPAPVRSLRVGLRADIPPRTRPVPVRHPLRAPVDPGTVEPDDGGDDRPGIGTDGRTSPPVQPRIGRGRRRGDGARRREGRAASTAGREEVREVRRQLQTGEGAPRQRHRQVRRQDGSLLPVGGERRRDYESQGEVVSSLDRRSHRAFFTCIVYCIIILLCACTIYLHSFACSLISPSSCFLHCHAVLHPVHHVHFLNLNRFSGIDLNTGHSMPILRTAAAESHQLNRGRRCLVGPRR